MEAVKRLHSHPLLYVAISLEYGVSPFIVALGYCIYSQVLRNEVTSLKFRMRDVFFIWRVDHTPSLDYFLPAKPTFLAWNLSLDLDFLRPPSLVPPPALLSASVHAQDHTFFDTRPQASSSSSSSIIHDALLQLLQDARGSRGKLLTFNFSLALKCRC